MPSLKLTEKEEKNSEYIRNMKRTWIYNDSHFCCSSQGPVVDKREGGEELQLYK